MRHDRLADDVRRPKLMAAGAQHHVDSGSDPAVDEHSPSGWRNWLLEVAEHQRARVAEFGAILVVGFVAAVVLLNVFAWLASEVLERDTLAADVATLHFLQQFSSPQLTLLAEGLSAMGAEIVLVFSVALLILFLWQRRWGAAVSLILVVVGAQVLNNILKQAFQRERPSPVTGMIDAQQWSFPSGHAMVAAAFYLFIAYMAWRLVHGRWQRAAIVAGLVLLILLIGISRLYLEVHYLSDVIAGFVAGALWADTVVLGGRVLSMQTQPRDAGGTA
jgi:undecaprenyl-diphosphatase